MKKNSPYDLAQRTGLAGGLIAGAVVAFGGFMAEVDAERLPEEIARSGLPHTAASLPAGKSYAYYAAIADAAATARRDLPLARTASLAILERYPADVSAWNRLVFVDIAGEGRLTRNGLAALYRSYEVSPYGDLQVMTWRVDLAANVWSALPVDLKTRTLAQIPVIAEYGTSWEWRRETCRYNQIPEVYQRVCATVPEVVRPQQ